MEQDVEFIVPGPPVAWHRPMQMKSGHTYKHTDDREYQKMAGLAAGTSILLYLQEKRAPSWDKSGEWRLHVEFYVHDLRRRDIDNLEKNLLDGLNGIVWVDDSQLCSVSKFKALDRENPRTFARLVKVDGYLR